jgi:serine/threonine protein kinase
VPLANGELFAGYRILRPLGSGSMGEVYLAQHPRLPRLYALKVLPRDLLDDSDYRERFSREADVAANLYHPHIVGVHDRGEDTGRLWISMDFVEGSDAGHLLRERYPAGMPIHEALRIITAVASALDYAHQQGCLHRDVKPSNILLSKPDTDASRIVLADFGIARPTHDVAGLTATNMTVGTISYAAPEQLMGEALDGRADQYALAVTAYQLLTGSLPFENSNQVVVIGRHLNASPPLLSSSRRELAALDPALAIALSKNGQDRFPKCADFARAMTLAKGKGVAPHASAPSSTQATVMRDRPTPAANGVRRGPTKRLPAADSTSIPFNAMDVSGPRRRWPVTVGAVIVILMLATVAFVVRPWQDHSATSGATTTSPSSVPSLTFDSMRDSVTAYYADLPGQPNEAWTKLDSHCQSQTGQPAFVNFWATIQSVTLVSIIPRDATSVTARLTYVRSNGKTDTEDRWLRMALINDAVLLDQSERIGSVSTTETTTVPPIPAPFSASAIDTLLASPTELGRVLGATGLQIKNSTDQILDQSYQVTPSSCAGVIFGAESTVYAGTGFVALRDQTLEPGSSTYNSAGPTKVEQTVVVFPTPEQAQAVLTSSQRQWQSCAAGVVSYRVPNTMGEVGWGFNLGNVALHDDVLTVSMAGINRESGNNACQQALGVRANVVVGARNCVEPDIPVTATVADPNLAGPNAERLAQDLLNRVQF